MKLTSVGQRYGRGPWLFDSLTVDLEPGDVVAFGGANGSGKSTVLALMAGLLHPTTGTITGRPRCVGFVPERFPAQQRLSAAAYLAHMGRIRGLSTAAAQRATQTLLERFSFTGGLGSPMRTLSKGNAQKVALAQALLVPPDLLILDEPWTGLDEVGHDVLAGMITETAGRGAIVALSRHLAVPGPVVESVRYDLDEARLFHPIPSAPVADTAPAATVLIELRRRDGARPLPEAFARGLVSRRTGQDTVTVLEPHHDSDRLLLAALQAGWSVVAVTDTGDPSDTRPRDSHPSDSRPPYSRPRDSRPRDSGPRDSGAGPPSASDGDPA